MAKLYIGIDNGVTGTIGAVAEGFSDFILAPVFKEQSYTVAKNQITRVDVCQLLDWLQKTMAKLNVSPYDCLVVMERPLINPTRFKASMSASRTLEAELTTIEHLSLPHCYTDSKKWQRTLLPKGTEGTDELKKASMDIGCRLFPQHSALIKKHKDADGLLIAYWAKKEEL